MARVALPITSPAVTGTNQPAATTANSAEGHFIAENDGHVLLEAANEDATATHAVTIVATAEPGGLKVENETVTLAKKGEDGAISLIRIPAAQVVGQSNGQTWVNVSSNEVKFRAYQT